ncbi:hypothetical protein K504DRAFT_390223 [Pleomassaria siparia CBS 279.74]|uniref:DUF7730 domain-containing protein n=1 Tax=Pleomassaria siparia CBS 279.74 TaxID=1314801 RepID=A0A6G1JWJ7_9PLEO|nr:hypothetical protein K504DRAFT_390223 [Pleomassaria siparia CBS 279.74]
MLNPPSKRRRTYPEKTASRPKRCRIALPTSISSTPSEVQQSSAASNTHACDIPSDKPLDLRHIFPFMKLPAELRINIYRMALQRETPLLLHLPRHTAGDHDGEGKMLEHHITEKFPDGRHCMKGEEKVNPTILLLCSLVYKEARQILYGDNTFVLSLTTGIHTLSHLHQRSRSLIKSVSLTIPNHHDILDNFADVVRLGLRYCWGLKSLTIILPMHIPDGAYLQTTTSIYSNAFHILRWLPKGGKVVLAGSGVSESIKKVVEEEGRLMDTLDDRSYLKRQHQMPERH